MVGHSSGAAVAGLAALDGGPRVAGVMFLDGDAKPLAAPSFARYLVIGPYRTTLFRLGLSLDWVVRTIYDSQCGPLCPPLSAAGVEVWRRPLQQPGAEDALWSTLRTGIPSLTPAQLSRLRRSPVPKSVVFGADDPQYSRGDSRPGRGQDRGPAAGHRPGQASHDDLLTTPGRRRDPGPVPPGRSRSPVSGPWPAAGAAAADPGPQGAGSTIQALNFAGSVVPGATASVFTSCLVRSSMISRAPVP